PFLGQKDVEVGSDEEADDASIAVSVRSTQTTGSVNEEADHLLDDFDDTMMPMGDTSKLRASTAASAEEETLDTPEKQDEALKKLSNVKKYPLDRNCLKDQYKVGMEKLKKGGGVKKIEGGNKLLKERRKQRHHFVCSENFT
ncbi:hypothetical protein THAOC_27004, partial [Thalassiosira oceanica]